MKWGSLMVLGALAALGASSPAYAQDEDDKECKCSEYSFFGPERFRVGRSSDHVWFSGRARLGIWVNTAADAETDGIGAVVRRVMEGGPAEKAGIQVGDIVMTLDGESLLRGSESYGEDESAPAMRLLERAGDFEVGETVTVELQRGSETLTVEVEAGEFDDNVFTGQRVEVLVDRLRELPRVELHGSDVTFLGPESFAVRVGSALPGLQLVSLNSDLGEYFGVDEGVLVVSVPEESGLGLKAGDVILKIDDREAGSPSHAMRILRSYDVDEEVSFEIRRQNRNQTVKGTMPEQMHTQAFEFRERDN